MTTVSQARLDFVFARAKSQETAMTKGKAFLDLIKAGKIAEARKMLEAETVKAEFEPDTITRKRAAR
jgi:hypothetical protein